MAAQSQHSSGSSGKCRAAPASSKAQQLLQAGSGSLGCVTALPGAGGGAPLSLVTAGTCHGESSTAWSPVNPAQSPDWRCLCILNRGHSWLRHCTGAPGHGAAQRTTVRPSTTSPLHCSYLPLSFHHQPHQYQTKEMQILLSPFHIRL